MLGGKSWAVWIEQYGHSHQHPVNRWCHTLGIPLIALSLPLFILALLNAGRSPYHQLQPPAAGAIMSRRG